MPGKIPESLGAKEGGGIGLRKIVKEVLATITAGEGGVVSDAEIARVNAEIIKAIPEELYSDVVAWLLPDYTRSILSEARRGRLTIHNLERESDSSHPLNVSLPREPRRGRRTSDRVTRARRACESPGGGLGIFERVVSLDDGRRFQLGSMNINAMRDVARMHYALGDENYRKGRRWDVLTRQAEKAKAFNAVDLCSKSDCDEEWVGDLLDGKLDEQYGIGERDEVDAQTS